MKYRQVVKKLLTSGAALTLSISMLTVTGTPALVYAESQSTQTYVPAEVIGAEITEDTESAVVTSAESEEELAKMDAVYDKEEVVYGTLDYDGSLNELYVVNQFDVSSAGNIIDHGNYDSVQNLTNNNEIIEADGTYEMVSEIGNFYYQGNMSNGDLPWDIKIEYLLDGKEIDAAELAGKSGKLDIHVTTTQNDNVDPVFYENYLLQITFTLDNDKYSNLSAEDAAVAAAGESKQINYTIMPDKDADITISADITDFEMDGISIAAVPFSMAVDLPDTKEMTDGLTELSDGIAELNDGTHKLADGADELESGMVTLRDGISVFDTGVLSFSQGVLGINSGIQKVDDSMEELNDGAKSLASGSQTFSDGLSQAAGGGSALVQGSQSIAAGLSSANAALTASGINTLNVAADPYIQSLYQAVMAGFITDAQYQAIVAAVGTVGGLNAGYPEFEAGLEQYTGGVSQLAGGYLELNSGIAVYAQGMDQFKNGFTDLANGSAELAGGTSAFIAGSNQLAAGAGEFTNGLSTFTDGVSELSEGTQELADETSDLPQQMQDEIDKMIDQYEFNFEPVSYISEENKDTSAVQFVITTQAIEIPEAEEETVEEPEETFWDRIMNLFKGTTN
ncbi:MAG: hypothetical protein ACK5ML_14220 [Lachnospiraceae bacterium]